MIDCSDQSGSHEPWCLTDALPVEGSSHPRFGSRRVSSLSALRPSPRIASPAPRRATHSLAVLPESDLSGGATQKPNAPQCAVRAFPDKLVLPLMRKSARENRTGKAADCPFIPGIAGLPPYLAGRERQQAQLVERLDLLGRCKPAHQPPILFGPRGNGKTTLLNWTRQQALNRGINVLELLTSEVCTVEEFVIRFSPCPWWRTVIESISPRAAEHRLRKLASRTLTEALAKLVKKGPAILLVDEAHTLEPALGKRLLHATLSLISAGKPFLFVFAGTPDLLRHMTTMGVTFWERSLILPIRRLDHRAASDAIRIPLESGERPIASDALERVVQESNGYPYFLQTWGELLWEVAGAPARPLGMDDVNSVHPKFVETRDLFYLFRYQELQECGLLDPAVVLAEAFEGRDSLEDLEVDDALMHGLEAKSGTPDSANVSGIRNKLHDLGYIWAPGGASGTKYYSGIPSLMSFVAEANPR